MQCQYCKHFQSGEIRTQSASAGKKTVMRLCHIINDTVSPDDKSCKDFMTAKFFWCEQCEIQMPMTVCKTNRQRRQNGCVTCHQGEIVDKILNLPSRFKRGN